MPVVGFLAGRFAWVGGVCWFGFVGWVWGWVLLIGLLAAVVSERMVDFALLVLWFVCGFGGVVGLGLLVGLGLRLWCPVIY